MNTSTTTSVTVQDLLNLKKELGPPVARETIWCTPQFTKMCAELPKLQQASIGFHLVPCLPPNFPKPWIRGILSDWKI